MTRSLDTLVAQSPLLISACTGRDIPFGGDASVFLGLGVTTRKMVSNAVPFDILMLILLAEKTRRYLGLDRSVLVVADSTARHNPFVSEVDIETYTRLVMHLLRGAILRLRLAPRFELTTMSACYRIEGFQGILRDMHALLAERQEWNGQVRAYVAEEIAIMEYVRRYCGTCLKLSWTVERSGGGFDERFFDTIYRESYPSELSFLYTVPGRTFDPIFPRACPYVARREQPRVLIEEGESVSRKLALYSRTGSKTYLLAVSHLQSIVVLYEELFGCIACPDLASKIQYLIDCIFLGKPENSSRQISA